MRKVFYLLIPLLLSAGATQSSLPQTFSEKLEDNDRPKNLFGHPITTYHCLSGTENRLTMDFSPGCMV